MRINATECGEMHVNALKRACVYIQVHLKWYTFMCIPVHSYYYYYYFIANALECTRWSNASECIVNECTRMHGNASDECAQNALGVQCSGMRKNARMHWNAFAVEGEQNALECTVNAFLCIQ